MNVLKTCIVILCVSSSSSCFAQEKSPSVISSAGDVSKGGGLILEWTLGEPAVETLSTSTALYTQGFHQPVLLVQKINKSQDMAAINNIIVYPNPATSVINLQLEKPSTSELVISLIDASGKLVLNNRLSTNSSFLKLNVSNLRTGTYILRIIDLKASAQSDFKIIKTQ
ncbi:MAG: T9SS type A sorting domain-containing protein [Ferruginibacter sp.]|nr:T9SS type A sorting domain-containing protein [Ferruginibacter sp.]